MPAFVSTLCICIVFVPVIFLTGAARYLFTPLALAVVLAMMASYLLSRTLVPTMVRTCCRPKLAATRARAGEMEDAGTASSPRIHHGFQIRLRTHARRLPRPAGAPRWRIASWWPPCFGVCRRRLRWRCIPFIGTDFFPQVDAGQIRLHVRAPAGTRIEETEHISRRWRTPSGR